jgi:hypothetical protein
MVLLGALAGIASAALSELASLLVLASAALLLLTLLAHRMLRGDARGDRLQGSPAEDGDAVVTPPEEADPQRPELPELRLARLFLYLGAATVAAGSWRLPIGPTVSEGAFGVAFALCVLAVLRGAPIARVPRIVVIGAALFILGGIVSSAAAVQPVESGFSMVRAVYAMLLLAWTISMLLRGRADLFLLLTLWTASVALNGAVSIVDLAGSGGRQTGLSAHPNELGGGAAIALVPALMLASFAREGSTATLARWGVVGLVAAALFTSGSVAGMAGATLGIIVWLSTPKIGSLGRIVIVVALIGAVTVASALGGITPPTERLADVSAAPGKTDSSGSGSFRLASVEAAWTKISADPFVGQGLASPQRGVGFITGSSSYYTDVHSSPIAAWYEAGILGMIGLIVVFAGLVSSGWREALRVDDEWHRVGWSLVAAVCAYAVTASAGPLYFEGYGWIAAGSLVGWWSLASRSQVGARAPAALERPAFPRDPASFQAGA